MNMKRSYRNSVSRLWFFFVGQVTQVLLSVIAVRAGVSNVIVWASAAGVVILGCLYFGMCMAARDASDFVRATTRAKDGAK